MVTRIKSTSEPRLQRAPISPDPRVLVVDGYDFRLSVRQNRLSVRQHGTETRYDRYQARKHRDGIARVLVLSHTGIVTVEAMRWCAALDVPVFQVSRDGSVAFATPGAGPDGRLVKRQVLCQPDGADSGTGLEVIRELVAQKISGQIENMRSMNAATEGISQIYRDLSLAGSYRSLITREGNAAKLYWGAWSDHVRVPWEDSARRYIPAHWYRFNGRASRTMSGGYQRRENSNATDFINAMLNYAYKVAETEGVYACHVLGLHPGIGLSHSDIESDRNAMALDILEVLRPVADRMVLSFLDHGAGIPFTDAGKPVRLSHECAVELDDGTCRLWPPITTWLASAVSMAVAKLAMETASSVAKAISGTQKMALKSAFDPRIGQREIPLTLDLSVTVADLVPDAMWQTVAPLIPKPSRNQVDQRSILAAVIAHEIYGTSWTAAAQIARIANYRTIGNRLATWIEAGVWDDIRSILTRPGVSTASVYPHDGIDGTSSATG